LERALEKANNSKKKKETAKRRNPYHVDVDRPTLEWSAMLANTEAPSRNRPRRGFTSVV
jgi:hypothetical protein